MDHSFLTHDNLSSENVSFNITRSMQSVML